MMEFFNGSSDFGFNTSEKVPEPELEYIGIAVYLTFVGTFSTIGNTIVIVIITKNKKLRKRSHNLLLLNLAVADLGISVCGYPFTVLSSYAGRWLFGRVGCIITGFMCTFLSLTDIHLLVAISVYRYLAVCRPHLKPKADRTRVAVLACSTCWLLGFSWALPPLLGWNSYDFESFRMSCSIKWDGRSANDITYTVSMIILSYLLTVSIMAWCYYNVYKKARFTLARLQGGVVYTSEDAVSEHRTRGELQVTQMSILMVSFFLFIWSPYAWVSLWSIVQPDSLPLWLTTFPTIFAKTSCCVNPIIYVATNKNFRRAARAVLCRPEKVEDPTSLQELQTLRDRQTDGTVYTIETTKEGIYIGQRTVVLPALLSSF